MPDANAEKPEAKEEKPEDVEIARNLEKAIKREERRTEDANEKRKQLLAEKRAGRKEAEAKVEKLEAGEKEEEPEEEAAPEPKVDVAAEVNKALKAKEEQSRQAELAMKVRRVAKNRQEAERIFEEAMQMPSHWDSDSIVKVSADRVQAVRDSSRGYVPPGAGGGGFSDVETRRAGGEEEVEGMSKAQLAHLAQFSGIAKTEEIKRLKEHGPDLTHVWGKDNPTF